MNRSELAKVRSSGPDVCWTPCGDSEKPVPYTSTAYAILAEKVSTSVRANGVWNLKFDCFIPCSTGTEAGTRGFKSNKPTCGAAKPEEHCCTVRSDQGIPLIRHDQSWTINEGNGAAAAAHKHGSRSAVIEIDVDKPASAPFDHGLGPRANLDQLASNEGTTDVRQVLMDEHGNVTSTSKSDMSNLSEKDSLTLVMHGSEIRHLGADRVARILRDNGFKGSEIHLIACDGVKDNAAADLSKHTGARVVAYSQTLRILSDGRVYVRDKDWLSQRIVAFENGAKEELLIYPGPSSSEKGEFYPAESRRHVYNKGEEVKEPLEPFGPPGGTFGSPYP